MKSAAFPDPAKTNTGRSASMASRVAVTVVCPPSITITTVGTARSPEHSTVYRGDNCHDFNAEIESYRLCDKDAVILLQEIGQASLTLLV